jgi:hypothetical protein
MFDWNKIAKVNFDDERRKKLGLKTGTQLFKEAYDRVAKAEDHKAWRAEAEPLLKAHLLDHMVNGKPIMVLAPIKNPTESLNGVDSVDEDDDGFYSNVKKSETFNSKYIETIQTIPVGTQLFYKSWEKSLGQWIFKDTTGKEFAIYDKPQIMFQGRLIENPGFFGLLHNTNIRKLIEE